MRKHSKIITILLSAVLAATLVLTVFIQAFASEMGDDDFGFGNASTSDEAETVYPVSMEVVKAPESVTINESVYYYRTRITDSTFWSNVVLHIVYSNGEEYDVNCGGIGIKDHVGRIVPPIAEIDGFKGCIRAYMGYIEKDADTVNFTVYYYYAKHDSISTEFSVKQVADPHTIVSAEVTKLPDKVFTAPLFTGSREDNRNSFKSSEEFKKWKNSLDVNNSISNHIDGMEITYYYANGEKRSVVVNSSNLKIDTTMPYLAIYRVKNVDEYGNDLEFLVTDEGDYKFSVSLYADRRDQTVYTAKSASNPNPSINGEGTNDTPANPSDNKSSATSDVATSDNANNNGTTCNGVVATGTVSIAVITLTVLVALTVAMYVWRKRNSGRA